MKLASFISQAVEEIHVETLKLNAEKSLNTTIFVLFPSVCIYIHVLYWVILYRCLDSESGQAVAMATLSTAVAVCMCMCGPMGVSSMSTLKAVNKLGQRNGELGGD